MTTALFAWIRPRLARMASIALLALVAATVDAGTAPAQLEPEKCTFENPSLWSLRFNMSTSIGVDQCHTQCLQGGGNGYLCLSAVTGLCLCGTAARPTSPSPPTTGCTATCAGSDDPCGGPANRYTCYVAAAETPTSTPTETPTVTPTSTPTAQPAGAPAMAPRALAGALVFLAVVAAAALRRLPNV